MVKSPVKGRSAHGCLVLKGAVVAGLAWLAPLLSATEVKRPNVLLIAVDDLSDWVGVFGGNQQSLTPNLDRFAAEGSVVFQRAYCPGPVCGPSRSAMLSGFMPHRSGVYGNQQNMLNAPLVQTHATLPEYFGRNGYRTIARGKIFHKHFGFTAGTSDEGHWAFEEYVDESGTVRVDPTGHYSRDKGLIAGKPDPDPAYRTAEGAGFEWGPLLGEKAAMNDSLTAQWAATALSRPPGEEPFFLAVGLHQPHLPWFVPREFYDRHPLESIRLPDHRADDLEDIRTPDGRVRFNPSHDYRWVSRDPDLHRRAVQAYLAAISYADECVGIVLEALEHSPHRDNTIVVILGDHGWHLGEKLRFRKATLWQESTRLPLMVRTPGMTGRQDSPRVVNLVDLYPTLVELCALPAKPAGSLDGRSLVPLLREPSRDWPHPTLVINSEGDGAAVISEQSYYIRHGDGTQEFYDMRDDPLQWTNLAASKDPQIAVERDRLAAHFPATFAPRAKDDGPGAKRGPPDPALPPRRAAAVLR